MESFNKTWGQIADARFWYKNSLSALESRLTKLKNTGFQGLSKDTQARNVILFLGDGMGLSTVTAIRKYKQLKNKDNFYDQKLSWDDFDYTGLSKTYEIDNVIAGFNIAIPVIFLSPPFLFFFHVKTALDQLQHISVGSKQEWVQSALMAQQTSIAVMFHLYC